MRGVIGRRRVAQWSRSPSLPPGLAPPPSGVTSSRADGLSGGVHCRAKKEAGAKKDARAEGTLDASDFGLFKM